mmetsp:Transcript_64365/g.199332  ORF Transcript_64365/g.199332 Transcript_64365/m.199332 type:complete len:254 (-) Transcript_64365:52-813(-)
MNPLEKFGGFWIPPAAESDLLRLLLLTLYGGVWADSTMLCRRPLDSWLPESAASGFFAFAPESIEEDLPVMSSFLASEPGHAIIAAWLRRSISHWSTPSDARKDLGFFWLHHLFGHMMTAPADGAESDGDEQVREAWASVPRVTGEYGVRGPHYFVPYSNTLKLPPTPELKAVVEGEVGTPMWKLTNHEVKLDSVGPDSCYWVLLEETRRQARAHAVHAMGGGLGPALAALSSGPPSAAVSRLLEVGRDAGCH